MATKKRTAASDAEYVASKAVGTQLGMLCSEDNFAGGLPVLEQYPELRTRDLSSFERHVRDWGFVYGLAFGLAVSANPNMAHEDAARLAYGPAHRVSVRWGGEIEDPGEKRENAIRALVQQYNDDATPHDGSKLRDAVMELVESARA